MPSGPSKRERQKEERRRQILEAALAVFLEKGFNGANVSDVAAHAGVSQGTIYWYFDSKDDLLQAVFLFFFEELGQEIASVLEQATTPRERLWLMMQGLAGLADEIKGLFTLLLEFWASSSRREEIGRLWVDILVRYKHEIVRVIEDGVQCGEFRPVDAESLAWALMAAYDGLAVYLMLMPDLDLDRVNHAFVETLLAGLQVRGTEEENGEGPA